MTDNNNTTNNNNNNNNKDNNNTIPRDKDEEQASVGGLSSQEWPTLAETKPLRPKKSTRMKIEGSRRTTSLFKRKGVSPYRKEGAPNPALAKGMIPKVLVRRVESYEGLVNIVSYKENGKAAEPPPGTSGVTRTKPIPTGVELLGTYGPVETTPVPTGDSLPGTGGVAVTTPFPTGEIAEEGRGEGETSALSPYVFPLVQDGENTAEKQPEEEEGDDKMVIMSTDKEEKMEVIKRGRGRPPTTGEHIGIRQKREAKAKAREDREMEDRAMKILDPTILKGKRWESFREKEEEFRKEFAYAFTLDLQARVMQSTAQMFKAADCSLKMKGSVVYALKEAAAATRAMMLILAGRAREVEKASGPSEKEKFLERQIEELQRKVERLEKQSTLPPESPTPSFPRIKAKKRRTAFEDEEVVDTPAPSTSNTTYPPSLQTRTRLYEERKDVRASHDDNRYCDGPSLKGIVRRVEAYPPGIRPQDRTEYDELGKQRAALAGRQNLVSADPTKVKEYVTIKAQMKDIAAQMDGLRMSGEENTSHSRPHTASNQRVGGAKPPPLQEMEDMQGVEVTSSPVLMAQRKKKKKKKKKNKGNLDPPGIGTQPAKDEKIGQKPALAQGQPGSNRSLQKPATGGRKPLTHNTRDAYPPPSKEGEKWSQVVGRRARLKGKGGEITRRAHLLPPLSPGSLAKGPSRTRPKPIPPHPYLPHPKKGKRKKEGEGPFVPPRW